ncbi:MAG: thiolase family protein, partial [Gammaproteobacteria bacterium]|nr:thiolase family protein [Gammaproteobacteria bacterium]
RWIVEPLHLLDCCLVSNGAVAVIVSSAEAARDMPQPPVYIRGWGQGHPGNDPRHGTSFETETGARMSGETAFRMAGLGPDDITQCQLYDCYTYTVLVTLEDYGFCKKGEGGSFVEDGKLGPGGRLPTNTGGGQLSGYYMWGMTPLSEGVIQARGHGGDRQAPNDAVLVSGNGGMLSYHGTLILSPRAN